MEAKTKKRVIIWTSVAVVLAVGGYFLVKYLKDKGIIGKKDTKDTGDTESGATSGGATSGGATSGGATSGGATSGGATSGGANSGGATSGGLTPTAEQTATATAYRIWANSTDDLSKWYGKKSSFDLDASSSNPYNLNFLRSYASGNTDYKAYLKAQGVATTTSNAKQDQIEQITKIAARYAAPILGHSKGGQMVNLFFGAKFQGEKKAYKVSIFEKNPTDGSKDANGRLVWSLNEANWLGTPYKDLSYKPKSAGYLRYDNGKFVGNNILGIGKGAEGNSDEITKFIEKISNNQIYGVFDETKSS
jgi:hypothetical protein